MLLCQKLDCQLQVHVQANFGPSSNSFGLIMIINFTTFRVDIKRINVKQQQQKLKEDTEDENEEDSEEEEEEEDDEPRRSSR